MDLTVRWSVRGKGKRTLLRGHQQKLCDLCLLDRGRPPRRVSGILLGNYSRFRSRLARRFACRRDVCKATRSSGRLREIVLDSERRYTGAEVAAVTAPRSEGLVRRAARRGLERAFIRPPVTDAAKRLGTTSWCTE